MAEPGQVLPVRVYQTADRVMVVAPMPGLEPQDIAVTVTGDRVIIWGEERGPHQRELPLLLAEWTIGPYHRELDLTQAVNGPLTNATYGNGVLVLSMPRMEGGQRGVPAEIRLDALEATRGERVGHVGRQARPAPPGSRQRDRSGRGLSAPEQALVREVLETYLADFRRQVAATESPDYRHQLQMRQNALERLLERLAATRAA